ncbi:hypothetical protein C7441_104302 [Pseudaminobacter salicylatoxidans]|uniref:Uncharacterized protein n=1 Tax=Pseudaminobacter salicylatoxidans TaxID=93369 RepID=A0A316C6Y0_PSESE|nr:hypothetical protein [Pseudaminobacter salicylatoxidans]PWJ85033.1 hypothetical protein C7441_104302 [Pseudaminobacter salicylatoxidans]
MAERDRDRTLESRRILERVSREADSGAMSVVARVARKTRNHVTAGDADDRIEQIGTRIGRVLGLLICAGLLLWLLIFLLRGA